MYEPYQSPCWDRREVMRCMFCPPEIKGGMPAEAIEAYHEADHPDIRKLYTDKSTIKMGEVAEYMVEDPKLGGNGKL